jgi:hypothetical protein
MTQPHVLKHSLIREVSAAIVVNLVTIEPWIARTLLKIQMPAVLDADLVNTLLQSALPKSIETAAVAVVNILRVSAPFRRPKLR